MRTVTPTAARDTVTPALHKAQETLTDTVLPTVRDAFATAKVKSADLLDSDLALEARRRGFAMVKAAKGETSIVATPGRRWRFGLGMIATGTAFGFAIAWIARKLSTPVESYTHTMPVPSGTDGGTVPATGNVTTTANGTPHAPSGTPTNEINLSAGAPTTF
jgi:hypothetical protein